MGKITIWNGRATTSGGQINSGGGSLFNGAALVHDHDKQILRPGVLVAAKSLTNAQEKQLKEGETAIINTSDELIDLGVLKYIKFEGGKIRFLTSAFSDFELSAKGSGSGSGSGEGIAYNRLDKWDNYTVDRAGDVLSAFLGNDLHTRLKVFEEGNYAPAAHTHAITDIEGLSSALAGKAASTHNHDTLYAPLSHVEDSSHLTAAQQNVLNSFSIVDGKICVNKSFYSTGEVSAKGSSGSGSGSGITAYDRLDRWDNYDSTKAGYVLSAALGYDLHTRLSGKVDTIAGKGLSTNDYTTAEKTKLAGLSNYSHPGFTARTVTAAAGLVLSAITVNAQGHVTEVASKTLTAEDIPVLPISYIENLQITLDGKASSTHNHNTLYTPLSHVGDSSHLTAEQRGVLACLSIIDGRLHSSVSFVSESEVSAKGSGSGSGGGSGVPAYDRLDRWSDYTTTKAGYVLSALLGYDLHTRLQNVEAGQVDLNWNNITGKPTSFVPSAHSHAISEITGLQTALDGKASSTHNHNTLYAALSHVGDSSHLTAAQQNVLNSFSIVDGKICVNKSFYSTGEVSAKGSGSGSGGVGTMYERLDKWGDYTTAKAGYVLSALLGNDLHTRLQNVEAGQVDLNWVNITGKPTTFAPSAHSHSEYALTSHTHPYLPLTAGASYPLTGPLFTKSQVNIGNAAQSYRITLQEQPNGVAYIYNQDHNGTATANLQLGNPAIAKSLAYNANNGTWGVGTIDTVAKLDVRGSLNVSIGATPHATYPSLGGLNNGKAFMLTYLPNTFGLFTHIIDTGHIWMQAGRADGNTTAYNLVLQPLGGNVGIGTTAPSEKLTVAGNILASGGFLYTTLNSNTLRLGSANTEAIHIYKMSGTATKFEMNLPLRVAGDITAYEGYLKATSYGVTTEIGARNSSHTHYMTTAGSHWFNKDVRVDGHVYAGPDSYSRRLAYVDEVAGIKVNNAVNADTVAGLGVHAGVNNQANKIVRTDGNGYIYAGWINTTSGLSSAPSRIYCSNDSFIRYQTPVSFHASVIGDGAYNFYAKSTQCVQTITVAGDKDTYYPVVIQMVDNGNYIQNIITITKWLGQRSGDWAGNHGSYPGGGGAAGIYRYEYRTNIWDGNGGYLRTLHARTSYAPFVAHTAAGGSGVGGLIIYLRGGNAEYSFVSNNPASFTVYYAATNIGSTQYPVNIAPRTDIGNAGIYNSISFPVVALKAQQLETSRTIWGQSFDGTGNVSGVLTGVTDLTASGTISAGRVCAGYDSGVAGTLNCASWVYSQTGYYITTGVYYASVSNVACITSATNEFIVSGQTDSSIYVNYRKSHQGYAPKEWYWKAGSSTTWADHFLGNLTLNGTTLRFASSPQVLVPSQSHRLALLSGSSAAGMNVWNLWVSESYSVDSSKLRSGGIYSRAGMIADGDLTINAGGIKLNTAASMRNGYSFYSPSWNAWQMYMGPAGSAGGVNGTLTAPRGQLVTAWALRSAIEPSSGYGWTWETVASTGTSPTLVAELSTLGHFRVVGNISAAGEVSAKRTSDKRFKENVRTITKGSDILRHLRPVTFEWNRLAKEYNHEKTGKSASFIAQEMQKVLPWAVSRIYNNYLAIDKEAVIPYLVSGWQEHDDEINKLKRRITELENEIIKLKNAA